MKRHGYVYENRGDFCVRIYDDGWTDMTKLTDRGFERCRFETREEAQKALYDYLSMWKDD